MARHARIAYMLQLAERSAQARGYGATPGSPRTVSSVPAGDRPRGLHHLPARAFPNEHAALKVLYLVIRTPRPNRTRVTGTTAGWKKAINALYSEWITGR
jgi:hypothetical protein